MSARLILSILAMSVLLSIAAGGQQMSAGRADEHAIAGARSIHQEVVLHAPAIRVYEALLDAKEFKVFSGGRGAEIQREAGGAFSLFDGHITGRNIEVVPGKRIVQAWRSADWPAGVYSIARFELVSEGPETRVIFDHTGFPPAQAEHLEAGWRENYWDALRKHFK